MGKNRQQIDATDNKHMVNSVSSKNSTLSNLEENLFSMMDENTSLLSETTTRQRTAEHQVNDEIISEAVTGDGAKPAIECVTADVHRRVSPSVEKKRGEVKAAVAENRPKQVLTQSGKTANKPTNKKGAKVAPNTSPAQKTVRTEKGGKPREHRHHLLHKLLTSHSYQIFYNRRFPLFSLD